ncbi:uncharacterized protein [Ptychodera flava]|uniref:uncharacterized protein n=1 Tax=Ptychodera flava TaxID=63121 RepID=UPI00396A151B
MAVPKEEVTKRFKDIAQKAILLGLTSHEIATLNHLKELKISGNNKKSAGCQTILLLSIVTVALVTVSALTLAVVLKQEIVDYEKLVQIWFEQRELDIEEERCIVENPHYIQDIFRPPVDCGICRNVTTIVKVSDLAPTEFTERYAYSSVPVVITDGAQGWTAPKVFSFDFFKLIYSPDSERVEKDCQFFPYQTNFETLGEVFNMSEERASLSEEADPWYIGWSNCDPSAANALREHYRRPYFIPQESESSKTDWIFMGSPGYGAHMHIDAVGRSSWQAQVRGRKKWTLVPPPECYHECHGKLEVIVEPGEIIVVDTDRWYHSTLIVGDDLSIAIGSEYD